MARRGNIRFPASDIWDAPEDHNRYEVIDGELYVSPAPSWKHQRGVNRLNIIVGHHVLRHGLGEIVTAPTGVVLDEDNGVEPDIVYLSPARLHLISRRGVEGAPDLVVEALSPSTAERDRGIKMRRYAAAGVPHYWLLDPEAETLEAYRLGAAGYVRTGVYGRGEVFRPELFPGLEIPIDAIWG
ncbi:MAG: Uma2 family endonuclease [Dehalococcoidia bacterium]